MLQFHETVMGERFFEDSIPRLVAELRTLNENLTPRAKRQKTVNMNGLEEALSEGWLYRGHFLDGNDTWFIVEREEV